MTLLLSRICWYYAICLHWSHQHLEYMKILFWIRVLYILLKGHRLNEHFSLVTAMIKAERLKLIYYYFTVACEGNHDSCVCRLFTPSCRHGPLQPKHQLRCPAYENVRLPAMSPKENGLLDSQSRRHRMSTLLHERVQPAVTLTLTWHAILVYAPHYLLSILKLKSNQVTMIKKQRLEARNTA